VLVVLAVLVVLPVLVAELVSWLPVGRNPLSKAPCLVSRLQLEKHS